LFKKKNIYYWSPFLTDIATSKAVINSAYSLIKYSKNYNPFIINAIGEFNKKKEEIKKKNINIINLTNTYIINFLPKFGKISSRISFFFIFLFCFFPLKKLLDKSKVDYLIIHLITSLPLILFLLFSFNTKCILRISGYPKINFIRKFFWKFLFKKIHLISCPSQSTYDYIKKLDICDKDKLVILYDPILIVRDNIKQKHENINYREKQYFLSIGRLTKQKNFSNLITSFGENNKILDNSTYLIIGSGEDLVSINKKIKFYNMSKKIHILPFQKNIFPYLYKANYFLLSSLWEDPGFVLIEAAFCRVSIISSNFDGAFKEFFSLSPIGIVYDLNIKDDIINKIIFFETLSDREKNIFKKNALILSKKFTIFSHYKKIKNILV
jgi:glycosyltransferase involved in cell wall biosynthesis